MNSLTVGVIHPTFQRFKNNGRFLHVLAAGLILTHSITHFLQPHRNIIYPVCLVLIAFDILILVLSRQNSLTEQPSINLFFRGIEFLLLLGIGAEMLYRSHWITGSMHCAIGIAYIYLFYCEKTVTREERISIHHTGITIPALPESKFFIWANIVAIEVNYSSIKIDTSFNKTYQFDLQQNLQFDELDQIHEFCRHYLGSSR